MLSIQPLTLADIPSARRLSDAAGWNQLDADWLRLITLFPQTTLAGFLNHQLIATASLTQFAPIPGNCLHLAWIGVMLVDPAHRGAGHGGAMFDATLRCGADRGIVDYGLDATDLGRPVYLKRNFTDRLGMNRWSSPKSQFPIPNTQYPIPNIRPLQESDWDQLLALDRAASRVIRAPLLQHLAHEPHTQAVVAEHAGKITGFALLRLGRIANYIGPLIAPDPATAAALFDSLLAAHNNPAFPLFIDVPAGSPLEPHLRQSNFTIARKLIRMARASTLCPLALTPQVYAIAGLELC